ncbi:MAG TPA: protein kinase, partial [Myxococcales bacterium]|nr:protein kinase [Myxococcales bacterium]
GSPAHLAPETIEGKPADPRSDLFSFGTILYWLSCGELPFQAPSPAALLRAILDGDLKDPRAVRPSVSDAQAKIIARCLERDPARRYQAATELRAQLDELLAQSGIEEPLEVVARFVHNAEEESARVRAALVARCLARGEEELSRKHTSAALAAFGRVLALDPQNANAKGRVDRIRRRTKLLKLGRRALIGATAVAITAVVSVPAIRFFERVQAARDERERQEARANDLQAAAGPVGEAAPAATTSGAAPNGTRETAPAASSGSDRKTTAPAATTSARTRERNQAGRPESRIGRVEPQKPLPVVLAQKVPARVIVDGNDLGQDLMIQAQLTPGPHSVKIQHFCCEDLTTQIDVRANRERYTLETGRPYDAELKIIGADPDAQVWYSGENTPLRSLGLAAAPGSIQMKQPTQRFNIIVGTKQMQKTLQAGRVNQIDMTGEP